MLGKVRYCDISSLFNITEITDECIVKKLNKVVKKIYVYNILPVTILSDNEEVKDKIVDIYVEFLKEINVEFQILLINKKLNIDEYVNKYFSKIENDKILEKELYNKYIIDLKNKLTQEKIYNTKYYIIVSLNVNDSTKIEDVDNIMEKLNKIGCKVKRLNKKSDYTKILYETLNKESIELENARKEW